MIVSLSVRTTLPRRRWVPGAPTRVEDEVVRSTRLNGVRPDRARPIEPERSVSQPSCQSFRNIQNENQRQSGVRGGAGGRARSVALRLRHRTLLSSYNALHGFTPYTTPIAIHVTMGNSYPPAQTPLGAHIHTLSKRQYIRPARATASAYCDRPDPHAHSCLRC